MAAKSLDKYPDGSLERGCNEGFLTGLAPSIPQHRYAGRNSFLRAYDTESQTNASEWFLLTDMDENTFKNDFLNVTDDSHIAFWLWVSFDPLSRRLLLRMPSPAHDNAVCTFVMLVERYLLQIGLEYAVSRMGSSTYGEQDRGRKQADFEWALKRPPPGHHRTAPTIVLEVALTERASKLKSDVRFWLDQARHDVNIALTIDIDQRERKIAIEKWELVNNRIHRTQRVVVYRHRRREVTLVTGGPLIIQFQKFFLRAPATPKEKDLELGDDQLCFLADEIWEVSQAQQTRE